MAGEQPQTLTVGEAQAARDIAYLQTEAANEGRAGLFWLSGFMSDMASTKATYLAEYAAYHGYGYTAFDYSGHGQSGGTFADGTIGRWLEEASAIFSRVSKGPQIIIGSSMGGNIALLLLRKLLEQAPDEAERIKGVILIAPAWDMTEELMWKKFSPDVQREIMEQGFHMRPSNYDSPYMITRGLIEDGRQHLLKDKPFNPGCPIIVLQGLLDPDVPAEHTRKMTGFLKSDQIEMIEIPDGEHRLSRPEDLEILTEAIENLA